MRGEPYHQVLELLAAHGIEGTLTLARHAKVSFVAGGRRWVCSMSRTPSDRRAMRNCLADVRRMLRRAGVTLVQADNVRSQG